MNVTYSEAQERGQPGEKIWPSQPLISARSIDLDHAVNPIQQLRKLKRPAVWSLGPVFFFMTQKAMSFFPACLEIYKSEKTNKPKAFFPFCCKIIFSRDNNKIYITDSHGNAM